MGRAKTASGAPACFLSGILRAGSLYPLARGCRRIWRGEIWFRPARCCSTGSGCSINLNLDLDLLISGPRVSLFHHPYAGARALLARPWSARCYGVARQREGSRQNSIGGSGVLSLRHFAGWFSLSLGAWVPKNLARRNMVSAGAMLLDRLGLLNKSKSGFRFIDFRAPRFPLPSTLRGREGAAGQAVVCRLLRGSSPTRGVAPKQHRGAGSLYPLARGCRRIWRGEIWFRPARCCSTGSGCSINLNLGFYFIIFVSRAFLL